MSVKRCCVPLCNKSRDVNVILHLFPHPIKDAERFEIWKRTISRHLLSLDNQTIFKLRRVCHLHFERQYHTWAKRLSHHAVPTLNISGDTRAKRKPASLTFSPTITTLRSKTRATYSKVKGVYS